MNILVVDDEIYIVRTLKSRMPWKKIGVDEVFTALNVQRAKEIIASEQVDILLTDIEMPQETGLELMNWVSENGYHPAALCLTCHADFQYAQEALRLGFQEYILKPVDFSQLEKTIARIAQEVKERSLRQSRSESGERWETWENEVMSGFWHKLLSGSAGNSADEVLALAQRSGVDYRYDERYGLVLFTVCRPEESVRQWSNDKGLMRYALANVLSERLLSFSMPDRLIGEEDFLWLVLEEGKMEAVRSELIDTLETVGTVLGLEIACYLSDYAFGETISQQYDALLSLASDNVRQESGIFTMQGKQKSNSEEALRIWFEEACPLVEAGNFQALEDHALAFLEKIEDGQTLRDFLGNYMQLVGSAFVRFKIPAHGVHGQHFLFFRSEELTLQRVEQLIRETTDGIRRLQGAKGEDSALIQRAKQYIEEHIGEKLSRDEIAAQVYLSPDYLTRLFKRETGSSLVDYILTRKIEYAKGLMAHHSVGEAATLTGYDNFSYFSELFKRRTGMTPSQYKKRTEKP